MVISLIEVKEKLKPQLKLLLEVDDFRIQKAEHTDEGWFVTVEYQQPEKGLKGDLVYYKTRTSGFVVSDKDGNIEKML